MLLVICPDVNLQLFVPCAMGGLVDPVETLHAPAGCRGEQTGCSWTHNRTCATHLFVESSWLLKPCMPDPVAVDPVHYELPMGACPITICTNDRAAIYVRLQTSQMVPSLSSLRATTATTSPSRLQKSKRTKWLGVRRNEHLE